MNINKRRKRLMDELKERDYRDAYTSSSVDVGVAFQIRALREKKEWSQAQLAEKSNMKQERISVLENPSYTPSLSTLEKLANAFDVGLMVRFVPFSDLVKWDINLSSEVLEVPSFDEDSYFQTKEEGVDITTDAMQYILKPSNNVVSMERYKINRNNLSTPEGVPVSGVATC